jgi:hypothetical protein
MLTQWVDADFLTNSLNYRNKKVEGCYSGDQFRIASPLACSINNKQTPWPQSARELYRASDRCLLAKLIPTFADRGCHVVSVTGPYGRILGFIDRSRYFFFQVAPQLYSRG